MYFRPNDGSKPCSAFRSKSNLKDLGIASGQTMVQKRPNDGSSHRTGGTPEPFYQIAHPLELRRQVHHQIEVYEENARAISARHDRSQ
jgi:hypothetical protein